MDSLNILNRNGYFARHLQLCATCKSQKEAWEKVEKEFTERYNNAKHIRDTVHFKGFSTYESFRMGKSRFYAIQSNR